MSLNLYTYVHNNPLIYVDPTGHWCKSADGNWSRPGGCNGGIEGQDDVERDVGTSKWTPDSEHDGSEVKKNGKTIDIYKLPQSTTLQQKAAAILIIIYLLDQNTKKAIHYNRNEYNVVHMKVEDAIYSGWKKLKQSESVYHQMGNGNEGNVKYVSPDGTREAVYNSNGDLVTDPVNLGTYNYYGPTNDGAMHFVFDVIPFYNWNNTPNYYISWWDKLEATVYSLYLKWVLGD